MTGIRNIARRAALPLLAAGLLVFPLAAQQVADTAFVARVAVRARW